MYLSTWELSSSLWSARDAKSLFQTNIQQTPLISNQISFQDLYPHQPTTQCWSKTNLFHTSFLISIFRCLLYHEPDLHFSYLYLDTQYFRADWFMLLSTHTMYHTHTSSFPQSFPTHTPPTILIFTFQHAATPTCHRGYCTYQISSIIHPRLSQPLQIYRIPRMPYIIHVLLPFFFLLSSASTFARSKCIVVFQRVGFWQLSHF